MMKVVPIKTNSDLIDYITDLVERCKSGEVIAATVVEEYSDGTYSLGGSSATSRTQTAGMLLDAAITRLNQ